MEQPDLILLHPPSVYDFRERGIMYGPISDLIPSSPVFEMYPLGFLTMTVYLEERGVSVRVVNLASATPRSGGSMMRPRSIGTKRWRRSSSARWRCAASGPTSSS